MDKDEDIADDDQEDEKDTKTKAKPPNWRVEEDKALCTAWLNTSKDAIVGSDQTKLAFWDRIHKMYLDLMEKVVENDKNKKGYKAFLTRMKGALENRWYHIQHQVSKFYGFHAQVVRRLRSGSNNDDIMVEAKLLFKSDTGPVFNLEHAWAILCHSPKWSKNLEDASGHGKSKTINVDNLTANPSTDPPSSTTNGPPSQNELLELSRQKQKSFDSFADNMNMSRDLTGMDEETLDYFRAKRRITINRLKAEDKESTS
ncbi:hypothetical protein PCANC_09121 [Puccinia coronata f. sp. avenae]|uniref:No apical meristem-associated C-terminal domain-containing protein n=1 Tax=Puccinia coronata f. sp. avenae TaxID=200324 RepID=A0A2N5T1G4_9BASI|nr:hypothetical protein PCANC_09121 [Puccinia coronata f. sp. avenae]